MRNRFFTILIVPEKSAKLRRLQIPGWLFRSGITALLLLAVLVAIILFDYWFVMKQIGENDELKAENRRLQQQVQIFQNKMDSLENTVERIETFSTRLRMITDIDDRSRLVDQLDERPLPESSSNLPNSGSSSQDTSQVNEPATHDKEPQHQAGTPSTSEEELQTSNQESKQQSPTQHEKLQFRLTHLQEKGLLVELQLQELHELLADQQKFLAALPTRKPAQGHFTSGFGVRRSPFGDRPKMHEGIDIANWSGTDIIASASGRISFAGRKPGYGQTVVIDHGYGLETWYSHASELRVQTGEKVNRGQSIAKMGTTGRSTGPHVHYEVRVEGIPVDPIPYILEN